MPHQVFAVIAGVASLLVLLLSGAVLLTRTDSSPPAACGAAVEWAAAAGRVQSAGSAVDPDSEDEWGMVELVKAVRGLARVSIPLADDEASTRLVAAMHETDQAGTQWLSEGLEYVSLLNSGMSSEAQRAIALGEFEESRLAWEDATRHASGHLSATCGLPPIASDTSGGRDAVRNGRGAAVD